MLQRLQSECSNQYKVNTYHYINYQDYVLIVGLKLLITKGREQVPVIHVDVCMRTTQSPQSYITYDFTCTCSYFTFSLGCFHCLLLAVASDKAYQLFAHGRWFSPASSTTKTGRHDIAEILLKVALSTKNQIFFISCGRSKQKTYSKYRHSRYYVIRLHKSNDVLFHKMMSCFIKCCHLPINVINP